MVVLTIDDRTVQVQEGTTLLEAARDLDIKIPTLCHHQLLEPFGACRMCLVEVTDGDHRQLMTSCNTNCREGMKVFLERAYQEKLIPKIPKLDFI